MSTLEVYTAVDICALLIVSRGQCPNKRVVVLHWWPAHLREKKHKHTVILQLNTYTLYSLDFCDSRQVNSTLKSPIQSLLAQLCCELSV